MSFRSGPIPARPRLALRLGVEIPDGVHDSGRREVEDALLGADPAELRVAGQPEPEPCHVSLDLLEGQSPDEGRERADRRDAQLVAPADREREAVALEPGAGSP